MGKPDNNVVTVDGVYMNGTYCTRETPDGGSISLYGPADRLLGMDEHGVMRHDFEGMTSEATAIAVSSSMPWISYCSYLLDP